MRAKPALRAGIPAGLAKPTVMCPSSAAPDSPAGAGGIPSLLDASPGHILDDIGPLRSTSAATAWAKSPPAEPSVPRRSAHGRKGIYRRLLRWLACLALAAPRLAEQLRLSVRPNHRHRLLKLLVEVALALVSVAGLYASPLCSLTMCSGSFPLSGPLLCSSSRLCLSSPCSRMLEPLPFGFIPSAPTTSCNPGARL